MSTRSLYNIIIKIIGLLFLRDLLLAVPSFIFSLAAIYNGIGDMDTQIILPAVVSVLYLGFMMHFLIFRTATVVRWLRLVKDSDEPISFRLHRSTVFMMVITILCLLILIDEIPQLINAAVHYFRQKDLFNAAPAERSYLIIPAVKVILAVILLVYQRTLINFFETKRRAYSIEEAEQDDEKVK